MLQLQPPQQASGLSVVPQTNEGAQFVTQNYGGSQNTGGPQLVQPGPQNNGGPQYLVPQINGGPPLVVPQNNEGLQLVVQRPLSTGEKIRQWANTCFRGVSAVANVSDCVADYF